MVFGIAKYVRTFADQNVNQKYDVYILRNFPHNKLQEKMLFKKIKKSITKNDWLISLAGNYDYQTKLFNHTNFLSYDGNNFKEVFYKISGAEKVFSSRAHGAIIGLIFKKQTYVYTIDPKLINIFFGEED